MAAKNSAYATFLRRFSKSLMSWAVTAKKSAYATFLNSLWLGRNSVSWALEAKNSTYATFLTPFQELRSSLSWAVTAKNSACATFLNDLLTGTLPNTTLPGAFSRPFGRICHQGSHTRCHYRQHGWCAAATFDEKTKAASAHT